MRLHEPVNDTTRKPWCGPTALSVLTGRPMSEFMPEGRGGMMVAEVIAHLRRLGFTVDRRAGGPTRLGRDGRRLRDTLGPLWRVLPAEGAGIAVTPDHYIAFSGRIVRCPMVTRATWVADHPHARRKVRLLLLVTR